MIDWKTIPSLSALRVFEAVAQSGDFAGAARALNVTHAAISQQVRGLERDLGLSLAQRSGRSIELTEAGRVLALSLSEGFGGIARCIAGLQQNEARRALRVATTPFIVDAIIMPRLSEFWTIHPGMEIALQPSVRLVDLVAEGFDLGVRAAPAGQTWTGLDVTVLAKSRWVLVGAPSLVEKGPRDPLKLPWVWTDDMGGDLAALRNVGIDTDSLLKVDVGSTEIHWQATRRGLGLSLASEHVAREDIEAGRLVELPLPGLSVDAYYAVTPKGPRRQIVDDFVRWLETIF
ncbi:LysR substrate-binding domain-containing protein [bacterium]|nr:LysR substrate-binding domain-containing protein [bacterium]